MLFSSYQFILLFLPLTASVFFLLNKKGWAAQAKSWLILASLFFYGYWNVAFLPILLLSVLVNYGFGRLLARSDERSPHRRMLFICGIIFNLGLLGYFKYANFFITNLNALAASNLGLLEIGLPIGISFYTFTQIACLSDIYVGRVRGFALQDYTLFVTFFPYVISGPIVHHREMIPQYSNVFNKIAHIENICRGLFLFSIGLFKKVAIADTLAVVATGGFDTASSLNFLEAWLTSLSYTFQLYFDFSGYTDMALGSALLFNIRLPVNFDSPYKSLGIREFWRRWHITLSRFLREYIYIPLGGNRLGEGRTGMNLILTFLIGGLWHGAAWTFVFWGFLHGAGLVIQRLWWRLRIPMPTALAWFITFNFLNIAWIFFRAREWGDALKVLRGMAGLNGFVLSQHLASMPVVRELAALGVQFGPWHQHLPKADTPVYLLCLLLVPFVLLARNSQELANGFVPNWLHALGFGFLMAFSLLCLNRAHVFLYFQF